MDDPKPPFATGRGEPEKLTEAIRAVYGEDLAERWVAYWQAHRALEALDIDVAAAVDAFFERQRVREGREALDSRRERG